MLYLDRFDVARDEREAFERRYGAEVLPQLRQAPGVLRVTPYYQAGSRRDPRYLTVHEVDRPEAASAGRLLPGVMNRRDGMYARVGGNARLIYRTRHLLCVSVDVESHKEALMNELYNVEHIPLLLGVPGVANVVRYRAHEGNPRYLAIYEVEHPDVSASREWAVASDTGRWRLEVKPYLYNASFVLYEATSEPSRP